MPLNRVEKVYAISISISAVFILIVFQLYDVHLTAPSVRRDDPEEALQDNGQCLMSYNLTKTGFEELEEVKETGKVKLATRGN